MDTKWKTLIISICIYQIILTLVILKLAQYSQWLYFGDSDAVKVSTKWYEGGITAPMEESLIWLGVVLLLLIGINIYSFKAKK